MKKKKYIAPLITKIEIDKTISLVMFSENTLPDPNDPGMWEAPPPSQNPNNNNNETLPSQFNKNIEQINSFDDNPFK